MDRATKADPVINARIANLLTRLRNTDVMDDDARREAADEIELLYRELPQRIWDPSDKVFRHAGQPAPEADPATAPETHAAALCRMLLACRPGVIGGREPVVDWHGTRPGDPEVTLCVRLSLADRDLIVRDLTAATRRWNDAIDKAAKLAEEAEDCLEEGNVNVNETKESLRFAAYVARTIADDIRSLHVKSSDAMERRDDRRQPRVHFCGSPSSSEYRGEVDRVNRSPIVSFGGVSAGPADGRKP